MDNARYDLENGLQIVRLNFTHTILSDNRTWRCDIHVISGQDIVSDGLLLSVDPTVIGSPIVHNIQLTIIGKYVAIFDHLIKNNVQAASFIT